MNSILKIYLGIFMMLCMTACSIGLLSMFLSVLNVRNLFQEVIETLSIHDYDAEIMESCMEVLQKEGAQPTITLYREEQVIAVCTDTEMVPADLSQIDLVKVEVVYPYRLGSIESTKTLRLSGYAW